MVTEAPASERIWAAPKPILEGSVRSWGERLKGRGKRWGE